jgi:hypothetical protein
MDVDSIPLGKNFAKVIANEVSKCDVLLAVIGPNWLDARDNKGNRRLDDPDDFVRIEIATALHRDIPVIPILIEGTPRPKADSLPRDIQELVMRNGLDVRHASFQMDMDKLIANIQLALRKDGNAVQPEPKHDFSVESPSVQKGLHPRKGPRNELINTILAFAFGVVFVVAILTLVVLFPNPTPAQFEIFRIIIALASGGIAVVIPGMLNFHMDFEFTSAQSIVLRASGALAAFLIVYFYSPARTVVPISVTQISSGSCGTNIANTSGSVTTNCR